MTNTTPNHTLRRRVLAASAAAALALTLAACSSDSSSEGSTDTTASTSTSAASSAVVTISDAWARTSPMSQSTGAAYMEITGGSADEELVAATVPASIAGTVELHETSMAADEGDMDMGGDTDMGSDMDMGNDMDMGGDMDTDMDMGGDMDTDTTMGGGMMTMKQVSSILIPAGETVTLEPGGLHIMLLDLAAPLVSGETFEMTLEFASGAKVTVPVEVRTTS